MEITASLVKELRDKTSVAMMECKKALNETNGDLEAAIKYLRERGIAKAAGKADRDANEGLVATSIKPCGCEGVIAEINCETDFVAKNDNFIGFVGNLVDTLAASDVCCVDNALNVAKDDGTVDEFIKAKVLEMGENLKLSRFGRLALPAGQNGVVASYIHMGGKVGVLLEVGTGKAETKSAPEFQELVRDITLHIAAAAPQGLKREDINGDLIEGEKDIYRKQLEEQKKPADIIEKILVGKVNKFYSDTVLLEQGFVKDPETTIQGLVDAKAKALGDTIEVRGFKRLQIGA